MKARLAVLMFCLLFFACSSLAGEAADKGHAEEWRLSQDSTDLGTHIMYVTADAIKLVNVKYGYQFICKAPDWTVHCFRPAEKIEWEGPLPAFSGDMLTTPYIQARKNNTVTQARKPVQFLGLPCTLYQAGERAGSKIIAANKIPCTREISDFLARYYNSPDCGKVMLYRADDRGEGRKYDLQTKSYLACEMGRDLRSGVVIGVKTKSAQRVPFKSDDFALPKNFRRTSQLTQVAYSPGQKKIMTETLDSIGFSTEHK